MDHFWVKDRSRQGEVSFRRAPTGIGSPTAIIAILPENEDLKPGASIAQSATTLYLQLIKRGMFAPNSNIRPSEDKTESVIRELTKR